MPSKLLNRIRQGDPEGCAGSVTAFEGQTPTVDFNGPPGNGQPQPGSAAILARAGPVRAVKAVEDTRTQVGRDAGSGVADVQNSHPAGRRRNADSDPPADRTVLDCIVDKVQQGLSQHHSIPEAYRRTARFDCDRLLFFLSENLELVGYFLREF